MATHFVCQSTEPLPHLYPTGRAQKSHGAVSQYEVYNSGSKAHTKFPPPGWDFSQSSEDDSLPLLQPVPQPEWRDTSLYPDPDLCITPQKPQPSAKSSVVKSGMNFHEKTRFDPDPLLTLTPEKSFNEYGRVYDKNNYNNNADKAKKVRFELENKSGEDDTKSAEEESYVSENINMNAKLTQKISANKQYIPELYGEDSKEEQQVPKDSSSGKSRTVRYTVSEAGDPPVYAAQSDEDEPSLGSSHKPTSSAPKVSQSAAKKDNQSVQVKVVREKTSSKTSSNPIAACRVPEESGPKRKVKVLRENQYGSKETEYTYPFNQNCLDNRGGEEHMFTRPEYNSTLRMKVEAERLKQSEIDVEQALKKKLTLSDRTKTDINEKASSHVNKQGGSYSGLVSLDLPADQICQQAAELKTARAKVTTSTKTKAKDQREPDLLEFFTSDRQQESVTFSLPGVPAPSERLSTAAHSRTFDLYKHNRVWEGRGNRK